MYELIHLDNFRIYLNNIVLQFIWFMSKRSTFLRDTIVFCISVSDFAKLDKLDSFIYLRIESVVDYAWRGKMFIYTMLRLVHCSWVCEI